MNDIKHELIEGLRARVTGLPLEVFIDGGSKVDEVSLQQADFASVGVEGRTFTRRVHTVGVETLIENFYQEILADLTDFERRMDRQCKRYALVFFDVPAAHDSHVINYFKAIQFRDEVATAIADTPEETS